MFSTRYLPLPLPTCRYTLAFSLAITNLPIHSDFFICHYPLARYSDFFTCHHTCFYRHIQLCPFPVLVSVLTCREPFLFLQNQLVKKGMRILRDSIKSEEGCRLFLGAGIREVPNKAGERAAISKKYLQRGSHSPSLYDIIINNL